MKLSFLPGYHGFKSKKGFSVYLIYLKAWFMGVGCGAWDGRMRGRHQDYALGKQLVCMRESNNRGQRMVKHREEKMCIECKHTLFQSRHDGWFVQNLKIMCLFTILPTDPYDPGVQGDPLQAE